MRLISANFSHPLPYDPGNRFYDPELGGGSLFDLGVYTIEFTTGILGQNPVSASGVASITSTGVDESRPSACVLPTAAWRPCPAATANDAVIYGPSGRIQLDSCFAPSILSDTDSDGQLLESYTGPEGKCRIDAI